jgi:TDG/mug DNA glycosylase family protein
VPEAGRLVGFPAIATPSARVLILGSMPGAASLDAGQYYAHPRNAFWPIMRELLGLAADASYRARIAALREADLALWDVLHACQREGSLDGDIDAGSLEANDFGRFFRRHPRITHVFFNGSSAERWFRRFASGLPADRVVHYTRLPSTSPAHAALSMAAKTVAWHAALKPVMTRPG